LAEQLLKKAMAMAMNQPCGEAQDAWAISLLQTVPQAWLNLGNHPLPDHLENRSPWEHGGLEGKVQGRPVQL